MFGDGGGHSQNILQVGGTILVRWRADRDELHRAVAYPDSGIGGELQPTSGVVIAYQVFQAGFINGNLALLQTLDLVRIDIHTDDVMANLRQHGALHQSDIAGTKYGYFHGHSSVNSAGFCGSRGNGGSRLFPICIHRSSGRTDCIHRRMTS